MRPDLFDGSPHIAVSIQTAAYTSHGNTNPVAEPLLFVQCLGGATSIHIDWKLSRSLGAGEIASGRLSVSGGRILADHVGLGENGRTTGFWSHEPSISVLLSMLQSQTLVAQIASRNGSAVAAFDTSDLSDAIVPVRAACDW